MQIRRIKRRKLRNVFLIILQFYSGKNLKFGFNIRLGFYCCGTLENTSCNELYIDCDLTSFCSFCYGSLEVFIIVHNMIRKYR